MNNEQKVYIRGVEGRGYEVTKMLTDRGGIKGFDYGFGFGSNNGYICFIRHDGTIDEIPESSDKAAIIMENYTELHLPERQWRDGDILRSKKGGVMAVYKESRGDGFVSYCYTNIADGENKVHTNKDTLLDSNNFFLANPPEIKCFNKILRRQKLRWDAGCRALVPCNWHAYPEPNTLYYFIDSQTVVRPWCLTRLAFEDKARGSVGNCFSSKEEAEDMADVIRGVLRADKDVFERIKGILKEEKYL